jgi:tRNA dimethylallyltransferase
LDLNPEKLHSLNNSDLNNPRRLIRAIEIAKGNPEPHLRRNLPEINFIWIGLNQEKELQKKQIRDRVVSRLESGAIQEVSDLVKKYSDKTLQVFSSLGVQQIIEFLNHKITREELIQNWTAAENDYARRQMVWFKKQTGIVWYDKGTVDNTLVEGLADKLK